MGSDRFHRNVGVEFVEFHGDGATMRLRLRDRHLDADGTVHPGVTFTLADSALGHGISRALGRPCTTAEMKVNYLAPVSGGILTARSRIVRAGRGLVVARAAVRCGSEPVAEALATFAILR